MSKRRRRRRLDVMKTLLLRRVPAGSFPMNVITYSRHKFVFPGCHNLPPNNGMFTREQLFNIREQSRRQPIPRVLRKTLSKFNIWHPSVFPVPFPLS